MSSQVIYSHDCPANPFVSVSRHRIFLNYFSWYSNGGFVYVNNNSLSKKKKLILR